MKWYQNYLNLPFHFPYLKSISGQNWLQTASMALATLSKELQSILSSSLSQAPVWIPWRQQINVCLFCIFFRICLLKVIPWGRRLLSIGQVRWWGCRCCSHKRSWSSWWYSPRSSWPCSRWGRESQPWGLWVVARWLGLGRSSSHQLHHSRFCPRSCPPRIWGHWRSGCHGHSHLRPPWNQLFVKGSKLHNIPGTNDCTMRFLL